MGQSATKLSLASANGHTRPTSKRLPELPPDTLEFLARSLRKQWKCYRKLLRRCQRRFSEGAVHDLRISARRLLSLLDLLSPFIAAGRLKKAQNALKCHLDTFDDLRDTQVQVPAAREFRKQSSAARCFYRFLKKREGRLVRSTCKKARKLRNKPLSKLMSAARDDVGQWLENTGSPEPNPMLLRAVDQAFLLTKNRKNQIQANDPHSIHCTRVAFKKFRYVVESLKERLPWANKARLAKMHDYQTRMGDIQDAEVLLRNFQKYMRKKQPDMASALGFERLLLKRRQRLVDRFMATADQLLEFWPMAESIPDSRRQADARVGKDRDAGKSAEHTLKSTPSIFRKRTL